MPCFCFQGDERPGPLHSFKFRYDDDICTFLFIAHSLADAELFTSRVVMLEDICAPDLSANRYIIGRKTLLPEGGGILATFDLGLMLIPHPLSAARQAENGVAVIEEIAADNVFIITVLQSECTQFGVSYNVRDNLLVASADINSPTGLVKKCSISHLPVFEERGISAESSLSSVWLPGVVPPLIEGLETLLVMGSDATISLPVKRINTTEYYKRPPPHLLRQLQEKADNIRRKEGPKVHFKDSQFVLPARQDRVKI